LQLYLSASQYHKFLDSLTHSTVIPVRLPYLPACYQCGYHWSHVHQVSLILETLTKIFSGNTTLVTTAQKYRPLYVKAKYILPLPAKLNLHKNAPLLSDGVRLNVMLHIHCISCCSSAFTASISVFKTTLDLRSADFSGEFPLKGKIYKNVLVPPRPQNVFLFFFPI
jgi:hypothetical protein